MSGYATLQMQTGMPVTTLAKIAADGAGKEYELRDAFGEACRELPGATLEERWLYSLAKSGVPLDRIAAAWSHLRPEKLAQPDTVNLGVDGR